jgi:hypothetical protein
MEGLAAIRTDPRQPLSNGRDAARFITSKGWIQDPIIAVEDFSAVPIIGYLGVRRWGWFTIWDQKRREPSDMLSALEDAVQFGPAATLIVSADARVDPLLLHKFGFDQVLRLHAAAEPKENYTIDRRRTS